MLQEQILADETREALKERRRGVERLVELSEFLPEAERLLIQQVYVHGLKTAELARLTGEPAYRVRRKLARILKRMRQPAFRFLAANGELFPRTQRRILELAVFHGQSLRKIAGQTGLSLHQVRQQLAAFRALGRL